MVWVIRVGVFTVVLLVALAGLFMQPLTLPHRLLMGMVVALVVGANFLYAGHHRDHRATWAALASTTAPAALLLNLMAFASMLPHDGLTWLKSPTVTSVLVVLLALFMLVVGFGWRVLVPTDVQASATLISATGYADLPHIQDPPRPRKSSKTAASNGGTTPSGDIDRHSGPPAASSPSTTQSPLRAAPPDHRPPSNRADHALGEGDIAATQHHAPIGIGFVLLQAVIVILPLVLTFLLALAEPPRPWQQGSAAGSMAESAAVETVERSPSAIASEGSRPVTGRPSTKANSAMGSGDTRGSR